MVISNKRSKCLQSRLSVQTVLFGLLLRVLTSCLQLPAICQAFLGQVGTPATGKQNRILGSVLICSRFQSACKIGTSASQQKITVFKHVIFNRRWRMKMAKHLCKVKKKCCTLHQITLTYETITCTCRAPGTSCIKLNGWRKCYRQTLKY